MHVIMETLRVDNRCSLEKDFIKLITIDPLIVFLLLIMFIHVIVVDVVL